MNIGKFLAFISKKIINIKGLKVKNLNVGFRLLFSFSKNVFFCETPIKNYYE